MARGGEDTGRVLRILERLRREYPGSRLALDFSTPLELLIALVLAAQCTDKKVNEVTPTLFRRYRSARDWAALPQPELEKLIHSTGFYRQKAKSIRACCQKIVDDFGGEVPGRLEDLLTLPGVGRKTANILLGNAFGVPGIGVDTHVARLAQRLGFSRETSPDKIEADLARIVPRDHQIEFCHLIQSHGRNRCFARKPDCPACAIAADCPYPDKTPASPPKPPAKNSRWVGTATTATTTRTARTPTTARTPRTTTKDD